MFVYDVLHILSINVRPVSNDLILVSITAIVCKTLHIFKPNVRHYFDDFDGH